MDTGGYSIIGLIVLALGYAFYRLHHICLQASKVDWGRGWMNWLDGLNRLFCRRYHRLDSPTLTIPHTGPAIVVSNHISGLDPMLMMACSRRPLRFLIAREQYQRFGLQWLFHAAGTIPVDRERSPEKALRAAFKALRSGEVVALFPHGRIHLDSDPPRRLKAGASRLAMHTQAPLVPLRISGVRRQGHVVSPIIVRGHAEITHYPPINPIGRDPDEVLSELQDLIAPQPPQ